MSDDKEYSYRICTDKELVAPAFMLGAQLAMVFETPRGWIAIPALQEEAEPAEGYFPYTARMGAVALSSPQLGWYLDGVVVFVVSTRHGLGKDIADHFPRD